MRTIVSLTSYGERMRRTLPHTLESLTHMDGFDPDMIILYLSESDYADIDKNLFVRYPNLTARVTDDIKSYKKYIAITEREFDDDIVFIADDDVFYKPNTYSNLFDEYQKHPERTDTVYATWCKAFDKPNELFVSDRYHVPKNTRPNECFVFCSGWGVLIPPHVMRPDYDTIKNGYEYANHGGQNYISDDKLMSAYCKKNNIKCACVYSVQHQMTFDGDTPLQKARVGKSNVHAQQAATYFDLPERDRIVISLAPSRVTVSRVEAFANQTIPPDKIIVTVKPDTKIPEKLKSMPNVEIQYDTDPQQKRFTPDTEPNDLVFVVPDNKTEPDTIERLFAQYYSNNNGYINAEPIRFTHTERYGHKPTPDTDTNVFRRKHTDGLPSPVTPESFIQTVIGNSRHP